LTLPPEYRLVGDPAALVRAGLFVAEGRIIVQRLLEQARFRVHSVAITPSAAAAMAPILAAAHQPPPIYRCDVEELRAVTGFDFHRGCLALAYRSAPASAVELSHATRVLVLEGVGNPDNVGGLFRTAFAFGVDGILLDPASADPFYRKAIRTSMAAVLRVPFARADEWPSGLDPLRRAGFVVAALTPSRDAVALREFARAPHPRLALVVGSEGDGLSDALLRYADISVRIPIDARADSLNVAVAAGIALQMLNAEC
jgi:tRNA G18 (ribose-2'-O)-methylase SpoU